ncbi:MAG: GTP-binding protein [Myxococcales bacterium]|nr:GTP-binding protein [Myxococcales bacterium]
MANARDENGPPEGIPALVVSGFLGSGKTTLVRNVLEHAQRSGVRVALVSNELGELGIDRALLGGGEAAYVELEGGCVCCELSDDLVETLERLHAEVAPDRIVIETSGVALPFDTQLNFWREPVKRWIGHDTAVVVVNAEQLAEGRDLEGTFEDQVSSADLLILNQLDRVPGESRPALEARLRALEPDAPILHAVRGDVDPAILFPPESPGVDRSGVPPEARPHGHEAFASEEIRIERGIGEAALRERLERPGLLRAKGFVETDAGLRLVQRVGPRLDLHEPGGPVAPELVGRLVLITRRTAR